MCRLHQCENGYQLQQRFLTNPCLDVVIFLESAISVYNEKFLFLEELHIIEKFA